MIFLELVTSLGISNALATEEITSECCCNAVVHSGEDRHPSPCFPHWVVSLPPLGGHNLVCNARSHGHAEGMPVQPVLCSVSLGLLRLSYAHERQISDQNLSILHEVKKFGTSFKIQ